MATKLPELAISENESRTLADAILVVAREYDVKITGKTAASLNLLATAAVIYGVKGYAIYERMHSTTPGTAQQSQPSANNGPDFSGGMQPINWDN